uniref:Uncharacterized protein n=1 Tax=Carcinus maenas virus 1 TaxID=2704945 RepID=A0A6G9HDH9_9VIRU|nr:hypothetical protein [Carcinus maenas virus 1]
MVTGGGGVDTDPQKVINELNDIRRSFKTTHLNGKTILDSYRYVTGKQLKKVTGHSNVLYILRDEEDKLSVIVIHKDFNIINEIVLTYIYKTFGSLSNFISKNNIRSLEKSSNIQIPNVLVTDVCVKILNLGEGSVIVYKDGTRRRVVNTVD